jgi:hypothetical protein
MHQPTLPHHHFTILLFIAFPTSNIAIFGIISPNPYSYTLQGEVSGMIVYIVEAEVHQLFLTIVDFKNMSVSM